jgi:hypothetical protein
MKWTHDFKGCWLCENEWSVSQIADDTPDRLDSIRKRAEALGKDAETILKNWIDSLNIIFDDMENDQRLDRKEVME